jgi:hypothetical protein
MVRLLGILGVLGLLVTGEPVSAPAGAAAPQGLVVSLRAGQSATIAGTGLTITALKVTDFSSTGCLGGPIGCRDQAELEVTRGGESRQITLSRLHAPLEKLAERGVQPFPERLGSRHAELFGYMITLTALHATQVTVRVEKAKE